jgi:hypothetical protein
MTSVTSDEKLVCRRSWRVPTGPWGATVDEMDMLRMMAANRYEEDFGRQPSSGDWLRFHEGDDEIVATYEVPLAGVDLVPSKRLWMSSLSPAVKSIIDSVTAEMYPNIDKVTIAARLLNYIRTGEITGESAPDDNENTEDT